MNKPKADPDILMTMVQWFNPYLNFHRPCLYVTEVRQDKKGRESKIYGQAATPYEKLKEISRRLKAGFFKQGLSFAELNKLAYQCSDNQFAYKMRVKEKQLFDIINKMKG